MTDSKIKNNIFTQRNFYNFIAFIAGITIVAGGAEKLANLQSMPSRLALLGAIGTALIYFFLRIFLKKIGLKWKNKEKEKITIRKMNIQVNLFFIGAFLAFVFSAIPKPNRTISNPVFSINDPAFKVLVLPFNNFGTDGSCQLEAGKCLFRDLQEEKESRDLSINVYYLDDLTPSMNFNQDSARNLAQHNNADLLIYGDYKEIKGEDYIKFAYYLDEDWEIESSKSISQNNFYRFNFDDFSNGTMKTGDIAFIINWVIGLSEIRKYSYNKASKSFEYLLDSIHVNISDSTRLNLLQFYISSCVKLGKYQKGLEYVNKGLSIAEEDPYYYVSFLQLKAMLFFSISDYKNALPIAEFAYASYIKEKLSDKELLIRILNSLEITNGNQLTEAGLRKAIAYGKEIIALLEPDKKNLSTNSSINYGLAHSNIGAHFNELGKPDSAIQFISAGLDIFKKTFPVDSTLIARNYSNIGVSYSLKGEKKVALEYYQKAFDLESKLKLTNSQHAISAKNLGTAYTKMYPEDSSALDSAISYLNKALKIQNEISPPPIEIIKTYEELAVVYFYKSDFEQSKKLIELSIRISEDYFQDVQALINQQYFAGALLLFKMGDIEKAKFYFEKGALIYPKIAEDNPDFETLTILYNFLHTTFNS